MAIKTRQTDGTGVTNNNAPLTNAELDNNFIELVAEDATKANLSGATFTGDVVIDNNSTSGALKLQSGDNLTASSNRVQVAFGFNETNDYQHFIQTRHNSAAYVGNGIDIKLCDSTQNNTIVSGSQYALSLDGGDLSLYDNSDNVKFFWDSSAESLGIGDTSPEKTLTVSQSANGEVARFKTTTGGSGSIQGNVSIGLSHFNAVTHPSVLLEAEEISNASYKCNFHIKTRNVESDSAPATRLTVTSDGDVGINTTAPSDNLEVKGSSGKGVIIISSGDTTITGNDVIGQLNFKDYDADAHVGGDQDDVVNIKAIALHETGGATAFDGSANEGYALSFSTSKRPSANAAFTVSEVMSFTSDTWTYTTNTGSGQNHIYWKSDESMPADLLAAYNASTGYDLDDANTVRAVSIRGLSGNYNIDAWVADGNNGVLNRRYIGNQTASSTPMVLNSFYDWDGAGTASSDLVPSSDQILERWVGLNSTRALDIFANGDLKINNDFTAVGSITTGNTSAREYIEVVSSEWPEIKFTSPTHASGMRLGMTHAAASGYGVAQGDGYIYNANTNSMMLIVPRDGSSLKRQTAVNATPHTIWDSGNDGPNSGLDADTLDGIQASGFVEQLSDSTTGPNYQSSSSRRVNPNASNPTNHHYAVMTFGNEGNVTGQLATHFQTGQPYTRGYNTSWSAWQKIWTDVNDGSGSGLDADTVDGIQGASFLRSDANDSATGVITFDGGNTSGYGPVITSTSNAGPAIKLDSNGTDGKELWVISNASANSDGGGRIQFWNNTDSRTFATFAANAGERTKLYNPVEIQHTNLTAEPYSGLHIKNTNAATGAAYTGLYIDAPFQSHVRLATAGSVKWQMRTGTTTSGELRFYSWDGSADVLSITSGGNATLTGELTVNSDERIKDNIEQIPDALEKVQAIRGVTFNRTDTTDEKRHAGVIAQEVEKVLPEVVTENAETGIKSVAYANMVGLLIEAIKEQQTQIDDLKAEVTRLKGFE